MLRQRIRGNFIGTFGDQLGLGHGLGLIGFRVRVVRSLGLRGWVDQIVEKAYPGGR